MLLLWQSMVADAAIQCRTSATRDSKKIARRFEHEGVEVLTLSLPEIGKAFERALDLGQVTDDLRSLCGSRAGFPVFLQNFLQLVFGRSDGLLLDKPSPEAIQAIRQLTLSFGKVSLPCTPAREARAFEDFVKCEQSLRVSDFNLRLHDLESFVRIGSVLFGDVFSKIDRDVYEGNITPRHGPGATADKLTGNRKYQQTEWTDRLEAIFPASENLVPSLRYYQSLDKVEWLEPGAERPVRVISVPKTLKTPRIIAIEPTCMQYMQQGLMERFVQYLQSDKLIGDMVGFDDQIPNQVMARESSRKGDLATLDLSEASDRVSNRLVKGLTRYHPYLNEAVLATRSSRADVPGYGVIPLSKFASMGSALTFPMEECVFLTCIFYAIEQELGSRLTRKVVNSFRGRVRVYGDDLIVPVEFVQPVIDSLELFGFKVNQHKSFWTGKFRESCGKEYYDGHDISIYRVRTLLPSSRADAPGLISTVSLRNRAYWHGYWGTARYLDELLTRLIPMPVVGSDSPVLGRESVLGYAEERLHSNYQYPMVWGMMVRTRIPPSRVENEFALLKCFLKRGVEPYADRRHLERQGRPDAVGIKLGWGRSY